MEAIAGASESKTLLRLVIREKRRNAICDRVGNSAGRFTTERRQSGDC